MLCDTSRNGYVSIFCDKTCKAIADSGLHRHPAAFRGAGAAEKYHCFWSRNLVGSTVFSDRRRFGASRCSCAGPPGKSVAARNFCLRAPGKSVAARNFCFRAPGKSVAARNFCLGAPGKSVVARNFCLGAPGKSVAARNFCLRAPGKSVAAGNFCQRAPGPSVASPIERGARYGIALGEAAEPQASGADIRPDPAPAARAAAIRGLIPELCRTELEKHGWGQVVRSGGRSPARARNRSARCRRRRRRSAPQARR